MFVPLERMDEVKQIAKTAAEGMKVGDPRSEETQLGPVVSQIQYDKLHDRIQAGLDDGAQLVTGDPGRPPGLTRGYYVRPPVYAYGPPAMRIGSAETFGPLISIQRYQRADKANQQET